MNDSTWFDYWGMQVALEYTDEKIKNLSAEFLEDLKYSYISHGIGDWVLHPKFTEKNIAGNYLDSFIWLAVHEEDAALLLLPQAYCVILSASGLFNDENFSDMENWLWLGAAAIQWETILRYLANFERTRFIVQKMTPEALFLMIDWFGFVHSRSRYLFKKPYYNIVKKCRAIFEREMQNRLFKMWMNREII